MMDLWIKALHVISIIAWMAGLLYLPRLFVYHASAKVGSEMSETFKIMEQRLLKFIMRPAMIASWVFGGLLISRSWDAYMAAGWMHAKLALVIGMTVMHMMMAKWGRAFLNDENARGEKFFRMMNEVPTVLMIGIVVLVIVRPF